MDSYIEKQLGNYRLKRLLGHGGFADVYLAEHIYLKTEAAIKVLQTQIAIDDKEQFQNEALLIAHLVHPHIIRVLDFGIAEEAPFLAMEYAPGGTLRKRAPKGTRLSPLVFMPYVKQIASALQYAHDQHLIHRDVKPENMLLTSEEAVKLSDFGIAVVSQSTMSQRTESMVMGTMAYMSPEQLQGKARAASDQYSLAIVIYEWLTGSKPFRGSYVELVSQHLSAPPPPIDEQSLSVPHAVTLVLERALSKDPRARFARIQDFAEALERAFRMREPIVVAQEPSQPAMAYRPEPVIQKAPSAPTVSTAQTKENLQTPPRANITTSYRDTSSLAAKTYVTGKKAKGCALTAVRTLVILPLVLCALSVAGYSYLANRNPPVQATALAKDFMGALLNRNYDAAYNDIGNPLIGGTSHDDFIRQAQSEDRCYGDVTNYQETGTSAPNGTQVHVYTVTRARLSQGYHLHVTVAKDFLGNWHVTDYNSDAGLEQPGCH